MVEEIRENPYFQYFIGLLGYKDEIPFVPSLLVEFRKRLTEEVLTEINEMIIEYNSPDDDGPTDGSGSGKDTDSSEDKSGKESPKGTISQPYIRPIVRGKAKASVEFGAKLDLSIDKKGIARLERLSFDAWFHRIVNLSNEKIGCNKSKKFNFKIVKMRFCMLYDYIITKGIYLLYYVIFGGTYNIVLKID